MIAAVFALASALSAAPTQLVEADNDLLEGWASVPTDGNAIIKFTFAVAQKNMPELKRRALAISTPGSDKYGAHMTVDEMDAHRPKVAIIGDGNVVDRMIQYDSA